jgi:hypothetical protein
MDNKQQQKRVMQPVVYEKYNEIVFYEPTEAFMKVLVSNSYSSYKKQQDKVKQDMISAG